VDIADSVIKGNSTRGVGGGVYVQGGGSHNLRMDHVAVKNNSAGTDGDGIYEAGPGFTSLTDVTFSNNTPNDCTGC
jgi:hypothetical protein